MSEERQPLTPEQAKSLLNDGQDIHVFLNPNGMLIGADWTRQQVESLINKAESLEVGGAACVRMKHGLVAKSDGRYHFIESKAGLTDGAAE